MKKIHFLLFALLLSGVAKAQFTVEDADYPGVLYPDSSVFQTNSFDITNPESVFDFRIKNIGSETIKVRIFLGEFTNANGDAELCLNGVCTSFLVPNDYFPSLEDEPMIIQPGQFQNEAESCKFGIKSAGIDPDLPLEYHLKFYQVNDQNQEIGTPINVTYRYTPTPTNTVRIPEMKAPLMYPNPATDHISVRYAKHIQISDVSGRIVKRVTLSDNEQSIDVESLKAGLYFVTIISSDGVTKTEKLLINK